MAKLVGIFKEKAEHDMLFVINKLSQICEKAQEAQREIHDDSPLGFAGWEDVATDIRFLAAVARDMVDWMAQKVVP